jgi:hypothetical protein
MLTLSRFLRCGVLILALCLAGSAAQAGLFDHKIDPKDLAGIKRVAVLSRLGDIFHASWVGGIVFQNKFFEVPVPEWGTDSYAEQAVHDDLAALSQFSAEPLDVTRLDLATLYHKKGAVTHSEEVVAAMLEQARKQGADALLIVDLARWEETHPFHSFGFGVFRRGDLPGCVYTSFLVTLFRVDTGKRVGGVSQPPCVTSTADSFQTKDAWEQYTPEEKAAFESTVKQKIRETLAIDLAQLGLTRSSAPK